MKRLSWNGVIFALAVCLIPAAASATDYKVTLYVPYNLTAIGPPGTKAVLACGINNKYQDFVPYSLDKGTVITDQQDLTLDHTGSARGTARFEFDAGKNPHSYYYRCVFTNHLRSGDNTHALYSIKLPQSMLRGVSGRLPRGYYRTPNHNHVQNMQMNRGSFIPPPMRLR